MLLLWIASQADDANGMVLPLLIVAALAYFVPYIIAVFRKHPNRQAILILNLLLGWTVLGWIGALVWAAINPTQPSPGQLKKCPFCAENVRREAVKCKHCGSALPA